MIAQFLDIFFAFLLVMLASSIALSAYLVYDVITDYRRRFGSGRGERHKIAEQVKDVRNRNLAKVD